MYNSNKLGRIAICTVYLLIILALFEKLKNANWFQAPPVVIKMGDIVTSRGDGRRIVVCTPFTFLDNPKPYFWGAYEDEVDDMCVQTFDIDRVKQ